MVVYSVFRISPDRWTSMTSCCSEIVTKLLESSMANMAAVQVVVCATLARFCEISVLPSRLKKRERKQFVSDVKLCMEESNKCRCMEKYEESQHPLIINKYTENKISEKIAKLKNRRKEALRESTVTELTNKFKFGSKKKTQLSTCFQTVHIPATTGVTVRIGHSPFTRRTTCKKSKVLPRARSIQDQAVNEHIPNLSAEQSDGITMFRISPMASLMLHRYRTGAISLQSSFVPVSLQRDVIVVHRSSEIRNTLNATVQQSPQLSALRHADIRSISIATLRQLFGERPMSKNNNMDWPARSPDISVCDFFGGFLKNRMYANRTHTLNELKARICDNIASINRNIVLCRYLYGTYRLRLHVLSVMYTIKPCIEEASAALSCCGVGSNCADE
ncbi:hypothetical protein ANN_20805, partial [Periplaneta americana]